MIGQHKGRVISSLFQRNCGLARYSHPGDQILVRYWLFPKGEPVMVHSRAPVWYIGCKVYIDEKGYNFCWKEEAVTKLTDNVKVLGNRFFNYFVVGKREAAVIECGTSAGATLFARQWAGLAEKPDIKYLIAPHSHFDHVCGIPVLKKLFPEARVVASHTAEKIMTREKVVKAMFVNDAEVSRAYVQAGFLEEEPAAPEAGVALSVDLAVGEGDTLEIEPGLGLSILDAPGHTPCSIALYLEKDDVMFTSDAAGYPVDAEFISPVFFQDYDLYVATLRKLVSYPTRVVGVAHGLIPRGEEKVDEFYRRSLEATEQGFAFIQERLAQGATDAQLAEELYDRYIKGGMAYYSRQTMLGSVELLIRSVKSKLGASESR